MMKQPLLYDPLYNQLSEDEKAIFEETKKSIAEFVKQSSVISDVNYATRNAHAKTYITLEGEFQTEESAKNLLKDTYNRDYYKVIVRISNAHLKIPVGKNDIPAYGFAIKIVDENQSTIANYPFVNFPLFPINSVTAFLNLFKNINNYFVNRKKIFPLLKSGIQILPGLVSCDLIKNGIQHLLKSKDFLLSFTYHSIGAYRFGKYMVKFKLVPQGISKKIDNDFIPHTLETYFENNNFCADLYIQYCYNTKYQPINILNKKWKHSPFIKIGTLIIPKNSILNHQYLEQELLSFNPFESQENLRPVGKIQTLRDEAYKVSLRIRRSINNLLHNS